MPIKAMLNNTVVAETDNYKIFEGNYYFPPESVQGKHLQKNGNQYVSRWKGTADYYDVVVGNEASKDAAWVYADPDKEVEGIKGYFSFRKDVEIIKVNDKK